jgi:tRNA(Ile)-lysidine synthase
MIALFTEFIKKHALFNPGDNILLAFSGGVDSVVMVDLFHKAGFRFAMAHCNFSLRGQESDLDEETAKSVAEIYKSRIFIRKFNTREYAESNKLSIEMAARKLRYEYFEEIMGQEQFDYVATAHHLGDVLETIILNLSKVTGISGVRGILPKRQRIIRPLLFANKNMIIRYAEENQLIWREDRSNELDVYQRNLIRIQVVPHLLKINPGLFDSLSKTTAKLRFVEKIYLEHIRKIKENLIENDGQDIKILKSKLHEHDEPALLLSEVLRDFGFNPDQCENIMDAIGHVGAIFLSTKFQLNIDRQHILISPVGMEEKNKAIVLFSDKLTLEDDKNVYLCSIFDIKGYNIKSGKESVSLDYDKLQFPLLWREWHPGDKFMPLGMKNKKKLSDFMIDEKIPLNLKRSVKVLVSDNEIAWVVGLRLDERFKISRETKKIFEITVRKK